jgi:hypothetical protein
MERKRAKLEDIHHSRASQGFGQLNLKERVRRLKQFKDLERARKTDKSKHLESERAIAPEKFIPLDRAIE